MRSDPRVWGKFTGAAALLAPVLAVQLTRLLTASGPAPAGAAEVRPGPDHAPADIHVERPLTTAQQRAADFLASARAAIDRDRTIPSPMFAVEHAETEPSPVPVSTSADRPDRTPRFVLTGIMAGEHRQLASVNNRVVSVGEEAAPGWKITAIDAGARVVTVADGSGRTLTLTPPARKAR